MKTEDTIAILFLLSVAITTCKRVQFSKWECGTDAWANINQPSSKIEKSN